MFKSLFSIIAISLLCSLHALAQDEAVPRFEKTDCRFEPIYSNTECGDLVVLENRSNPDGATIRLHVGIIKSTSESPSPDPVIFLSGGPGSPFLEYLDTLYGFAVLNIHRDIIIFDQRGVGLSQPSLGCGFVSLPNYRQREDDLSPIERNALLVEGHERCQIVMLLASHQLSAYNTIENAADVHDLQSVLGYDQWNLYGISYGSRLGLEVLRRYPEDVRSAVFMGIVPPQANWIVDLPTHAEHAFREFFDSCVASTYCNDYYPELETVFYDLVVALSKETQYVDINLLGDDYTIAVRADTYVQMLFSALYEPGFLREMPKIITEASRGNHEIAAQIQLGGILGDTLLSLGLHYSIVCNETLNETSIKELIAADSAFRFQYDAFDMEYYVALCDMWRTDEQLQVDNSPVYSDVPTLLLSGQYDPITPAEYGELAVQTLSNGYHYILPYTGHGTSYNPCASLLIREFIDDPYQQPDTTCIADINPIVFRRPER